MVVVVVVYHGYLGVHFSTVPYSSAKVLSAAPPRAAVRPRTGGSLGRGSAEWTSLSDGDTVQYCTLLRGTVLRGTRPLIDLTSSTPRTPDLLHFNLDCSPS